MDEFGTLLGHLPPEFTSFVMNDDEQIALDDGLTTPAEVAEVLRKGGCPPDRAFDRFLPAALNLASSQFWTPLAVVQRAAEWIDELSIETVVDVGSGAGKFCVAAALFTRARYIGIEHRPHLVEAARELARAFEVDDRVSFEIGSLGEAPLPEGHAYYLYNPFGENLFGPTDHLDEEVELSTERYFRDVAVVENHLRMAPVGTCLMTYNGYGGAVPTSYQQVRIDRKIPNLLRMWKKLGPRQPRS